MQGPTTKNLFYSNILTIARTVELIPKVEIYIELKGSDLAKAVSQLQSTLGHFSALHNARTKKCYAIVTQVPRGGPKVQKLKSKFIRETSVQLSVEKTKYEIAI